MAEVLTLSSEIMGVDGTTATVLYRYSDGTTFQTTIDAPAPDPASVAAAVREAVKGPNGEEAATVVCAAPEVIADAFGDLKDAKGKPIDVSKVIADAEPIRTEFEAVQAEALAAVDSAELIV